jgi:hypothetical protein
MKRWSSSRRFNPNSGIHSGMIFEMFIQILDDGGSITNPTNLYSQVQFPNMDLAFTFHVGLCLRIPSSERQSVADLEIEPLVACWRTFEEASEELKHAEEVEDFQAIGTEFHDSYLK